MENTSLNQLAPRKKLAFLLIWIGLCGGFVFFSAEIFVRVFFRYNTPDTVRQNSVQYSPSVYSRLVIKPNQVIRTDLAWGLRSEKEKTDLTYFINEFGYRGPSFSTPKPNGVCRIVVLGGSAVFDRNADDWPHLLETFLKAMGYTNVEVINAGVPGHATFDSLGRLYSQIWTFDPDYILVYHGWNDFKYWRTLTREKPLIDHFTPLDENANPFQTYQGFLDRLLCMSQIYVKFRNRYFIWKMAVGPEGPTPQGEYQSTYSPLAVRQFKLGNQQAKSKLIKTEDIKGVTYQEEVELVKRKLSDQEVINENELSFLTHRSLMRELRLWASANSVPFVDIIEATNGDRDVLLSWVHLSPRGNRLVAQAFAKEILRHECSEN